MYQIELKESASKHMTVQIFYGMMRDLYYEVTEGQSSIEGPRIINPAMFYYGVEVVEWLYDGWIKELVAPELYGKTINGITFGNSFHEFFDLQWSFLEEHVSSILSRNLMLYGELIGEFYEELIRQRICFSIHEPAELSRLMPTMALGDFLYPQSEVW